MTAVKLDAAVLGEQLYADNCASCHGGDGEGNEEYYSDPLHGDFSVGELASLISDTMPEGEPELIVDEQADAVAVYIHAKFYGPAAQLRTREVRATFSRLTGDQLRQSVADLYGHFNPQFKLPEQNGLNASYQDGTKWKKDGTRVEQIDPQIDFDFGHDSPVEGIAAKDFRVVWKGSLMAPRTGSYELIVRSSCSFTLDFERDDFQLIDNHVQSEGKDEFRRTMKLIAGRPYRIDLEMLQRERKTEQPPAKISFSWVPPGGVEEIIPTRYWVPTDSSQIYSLQTRLPPDDQSYGYQRGTAIDRSWDDSTTAAALEFGPIVASELFPPFYKRKQREQVDGSNRNILRMFCEEFLQLAFRGDVDDQVRQQYIESNLQAAEDDGLAIRRFVLMVMKSPRFLYPTLDSNQTDSRRRLNRLTLTMFDSLPSEQWLIQRAEKEQLTNPKQVQDVAWAMVDDPRGRAKIRDFLYHWMELDDLDELVKDQTMHSGFGPRIVEDLRSSLDAFLAEVVGSGGSDFRQLVAANWTMTNDRLAEFYGAAWKPANADAESNREFRKSVGDPTVHVGVLTHPLLMSRFAYHETTSPIHRGVYLTRHVFGRVLRPPNAAFTPLDPTLHPGMTTRERVQLQTGEVNCQVCHSKINGLGFALEQFDAVGRFRDREVGRTVDASGTYTSTTGEAIEFSGARELGDIVAASEDAHRAFVESAFEYFVKQPPAAFGDDVAEQLLQHFHDSDFHIRGLIVEIAKIASGGSLADAELVTRLRQDLATSENSSIHR